MKIVLTLKKSLLVITMILIAVAMFICFNTNDATDVALAFDYDTSNAVDLNSTELQGSLSGVNYIQNSNYFISNPGHHTNYGSDGKYGVCSTV